MAKVNLVCFGRLLQKLAQTTVLAAGVNLVYLVFESSYDFRLGPIHLFAHGIFKPLMILSASFMVAVLLRWIIAEDPALNDTSVALPPVTIGAAICLAYAISFLINYHDAEWAHTDISAAHVSFWSLRDYFTHREYDGFYRPIGFLSLWLDWKLFGKSLCWYHLQSLFIHVTNSYLVSRLCRQLGFVPSIAVASALVFAVAPVSFETVLWPGARFDELATLYSLLSIGTTIHFVKGGGARMLVAHMVFLTLALLSKESAYAVPLLLIPLALRERPSCRREAVRWIQIGVATIIVVVVALSVRLFVLDGIGGYTTATGSSLHFVLSLKTLTSLLQRAFLASQFAVDGTVVLPWWIRSLVAICVLLLAYIVFTYRPVRSDRKPWFILTLFFISLLPVANVITFVGPALVQGRYLYLSSVWSSILIGTVIVRTSHPRLAVAVWTFVAAGAVFFNVSVHRDRLESIPKMVAQIRSALVDNPSCTQVALVNMPDQMNGSLFASQELLQTLRITWPQVTFTFSGASVTNGPPSSACLAYSWNDLHSPQGLLRKSNR